MQLVCAVCNTCGMPARDEIDAAESAVQRLTESLPELSATQLLDIRERIIEMSARPELQLSDVVGLTESVTVPES